MNKNEPSSTNFVLFLPRYPRIHLLCLRHPRLSALTHPLICLFPIPPHPLHQMDHLTVLYTIRFLESPFRQYLFSFTHRHVLLLPITCKTVFHPLIHCVHFGFKLSMNSTTKTHPTCPIPKHTIPSDQIILRSVLAPTVKPTDVTSLWKLNIRHCGNGKPLKGMSLYGDTRAPTVSPDTVRFQLAYGTSLGFIHKTYDCTNAFQCTFEDDPSKRIYCYPPPFYLKWYNSRYSHDQVDSSNGPFVLQAAQLIQGSPHAANRWQQNLHLQITSFGFIRNNIDHSFYVKHNLQGEIEAMLSITDDDLLLSTKQSSLQEQFYTHLSSAFDITTPSDSSWYFFCYRTVP